MPSAGTVCHNLLGGFKRRVFQSVFSSNTVVVVIPSVSSSMQFCKGTFLSSHPSWSSSSSSRMMVTYRALLSSGAQHSREKQWNQASSHKYNKTKPLLASKRWKVIMVFLFTIQLNQIHDLLSGTQGCLFEDGTQHQWCLKASAKQLLYLPFPLPSSKAFPAVSPSLHQIHTICHHWRS